MTINRWITMIAITLLSLFVLQNNGEDLRKTVVLLAETVLGCAIVTISASFAQWCFTHINFTKSSDGIKTLGYIFIGCALVYFGYVVGGYKTLFLQ